MIDKLTNCPNCGGTLNEAGRCSFCGSKVYDFLSINFDHTYRPSAKTYIRIKSGGKIILAPVIVNNASIETRVDEAIGIELDLAVIGEVIQIDDEGDTE